MDVLTLIFVGVFVLFLLGATWAAAGISMPDYRRSTMQWAAFNLFEATTLIALSNFMSFDGLPLRSSDLTVLLAFTILRRGLQVFVRIKPTNIEHVAILLIVWSALFFLRQKNQEFWGTVLVNLTVAFVMIRSVLETRERLSHECGRVIASIVSGAFSTIGFGFLVRALTVLMPPDWIPLLQWRSPSVGVGFLLLIVTISVPLNMALAIAIIGQLITQARNMAMRDHLTGIPNRRHIEAFLQSEIARFARQSSPFCVLMCDIDKFKSVNDTYGHKAGDVVLIEVAKVMTKLARETDMVGRLGGEEFCIILPMTNLDGGIRAGERFRAGLQSHRIVVDGRHIPLTSSFGVACYTSSKESWSELLSRADAALYLSKRNGRNQVTAALPFTDTGDKSTVHGKPLNTPTHK